MMAKMTRKQAQSRNWQIKRLRGAYSLFTTHLGTRSESARLGQVAVDQLLEALGAETETDRRIRIWADVAKPLDNLKKV